MYSDNHEYLYTLSDCSFSIVPRLSVVDARDFESYLSNLNRKLEPHRPSIYKLFWILRDSKIVTSGSSTVYNNPHHQLVCISNWLYARSYSLEGSATFRIESVVYRIVCNRSEPRLLTATWNVSNNCRFESNSDNSILQWIVLSGCIGLAIVLGLALF